MSHHLSPFRTNWIAVVGTVVGIVIISAAIGSLILGDDVRVSTGPQSAEPRESPVRPRSVVVGLDVSASSMDKDLAGPLSQLRELLLEHYDAEVLEALCFDMRANVLYSGEPPRGEEPATALITGWMRVGVDPRNFGTSLPNFLRTVDRRLRDLPKPARVLVLTDYGTENVAEKDLRECRRITEGWRDKGEVIQVTILGLQASGRNSSIERIEAAIPRELLDPRFAY
ncbi:MAG: hypothetical protein N2109_02590 [Fimbriimonadales bacterium]|nr:hypothetical protein [Fimbriimonadales bacterium]